MKLLSRDFTRGEKNLLLLLALVLVVLIYFRFVDRPVREGLARAASEKDALQVELTALNNRLQRMEEMEDELDGITADPKASRMGSYNNSKEEIAFLNDLLEGTESYSVSFSSVTRDGDQIRRNFTLQFTVGSYADMERILTRIADGSLRCLLNDISYNLVRTWYSPADRELVGRDYSEHVNVSATATFFETMVGGTPDAGLPDSGRAA